jgi:hypothetical protein
MGFVLSSDRIGIKWKKMEPMEGIENTRKKFKNGKKNIFFSKSKISVEDKFSNCWSANETKFKMNGFWLCL